MALNKDEIFLCYILDNKNNDVLAVGTELECETFRSNHSNANNICIGDIETYGYDCAVTASQNMEFNRI